MSRPFDPSTNVIICPQCRQENTTGRSTCRHCGSPLPVTAGPTRFSQGSQPSHSFRRGQIFANRYVIQDVIGRGGMGAIYKVYDNTLKETVALKSLLPELVRDPIVVERFFNEARIARSLSHPNIVRVHDIGTAEDVVYISMEYLKGKSLRDILEGLTPGQRVGIKTVLRIFDELCAALQYAHRFTIHRDIKPENVMIATDGHVKLMDFGISKLRDRTSLTQASMVMGTPQYMSPEQLRNTSAVDGRADIYSVGVMLYEVLTGNVPTGVPKPVSEIQQSVPPALDPIIAKCVDPDPNKRYQTAAELRDALGQVRRLVEAGSDLIQITAQPPAKRTVSWVRPGLTALALLAIAAGALFGIRQAEARRVRLIEEASAVTSIPSPPPSPIVTGDPAASYAEWEMLVNRARSKAMAASRSAASDVARARIDRWVEAGRDQAELAAKMAESNPASAIRECLGAVHYFMAATLVREGMTFIPPGFVSIPGESESPQVTGFFIQTSPVSSAQFGEFAATANWRQSGPGGSAPENPAVGVAYYDALAYAASQQPRLALPSRAQWHRAAQFMGESETLALMDAGAEEVDEGALRYRLAEQLYEWTRTRADGESLAPGFRTELYICGGQLASAASAVFDTMSLVYESRMPNVGFRCVYELPDTLDALEALLT